MPGWHPFSAPRRLIRSTATTTSGFRGQALGGRRALCRRIASGVGRTQGGGGSCLAYLRQERGQKCWRRGFGGCSRSPGRLPRDAILIRRHHFALAAPVIVVGPLISPIADLAVAAIAEAGRASR